MPLFAMQDPVALFIQGGISEYKLQNRLEKQTAAENPNEWISWETNGEAAVTFPGMVFPDGKGKRPCVIRICFRKWSIGSYWRSPVWKCKRPYHKVSA